MDKYGFNSNENKNTPDFYFSNSENAPVKHSNNSPKKSNAKKKKKSSSGVGLEHDILLSMFLLDKKAFHARKPILPFYQNIEKDGVVVYAA